MSKRSPGVLVLAILFILGALIQLPSVKFDDYKIFFQPLPEKVIIVHYFFIKVLLILGIISGIGILLLKNIFRKIAVFLSAYTIFNYLVEGPFFIFRNVPQYINNLSLNISSQTKSVSLSFISGFLWNYTIIAWVLDFSFAILIIYFFTRSKVKDQFS
jgi:hypothetical protein